jgi:hypothetical protein
VVQWLEEIPREGEVAGSYPTDRVATKNAVTCDFDTDERTLAGGALPPIKKNPYFFGIFSIQPLPSVGHSTKPLPSARQKTLGKDSFTDAFFTE